MNTLFENLSPDAQKALSQARSSFEQAGQNWRRFTKDKRV